MKKSLRTIMALCLTAATIASSAQAAAPRPPGQPMRKVPLDQRETVKYTRHADKEVTVLVRLTGESVAAFSGDGFKQLRAENGSATTRAAQQEQSRGINAAQSALVAQIATSGVRVTELARLTNAVNGVALRVKAGDIEALRALAGVESVRLINNYKLDLSETVPYIGAKAVQDSGVTGAGVRVAVLDSGIDYTHKNLGGDGTAAAYAAAYGTATTDAKNTTRDGLFPTAKVVDGFDFVGETWGVDAAGDDIGVRTEDPDPIDCGNPAITDVCDGGHGTHVGDIIAGASADHTHVGVAPGASLLAVKVCSAISTACNGVALLKAVDFALDPNGDGDLSDAVDVINLSLGSSYGMKQDDLSFALAQAVRLGVVVVASAGNSADRPYIVGSPSSQPEVLSVAQTSVPSAKTFPLVLTIAGVQTTISNTNTVDWAPLGAGFTGDVVALGRGCPAAELGTDDAYLGNPAGKVALIDRGACSISSKVDRAARAGAIAVILANNADGDPPTFSLGTGTQFVPVIVITRGTGLTIKTALATGPVTATVSSAVSIALVGSVVASSSRGPSYSYNAIKPEIGAPGASVSAEAGTFTGETAFGGTSGAAPMVSGAAALLLSARPKLSPRDVKALLVTTADANIVTNPATEPGVLAPITRIGGGEVRVNRAVASKTAAWASNDQNPALSFGYRSVSADMKLSKRIVVRNYSNKRRTYTITPSFRYADDAASGAITPSAPDTITVGPNASKTFELELSINAAKLPEWSMSGGDVSGFGPGLQAVEFDGYLDIAEGDDKIHLPWQVLPASRGRAFGGVAQGASEG